MILPPSVPNHNPKLFSIILAAKKLVRSMIAAVPTLSSRRGCLCLVVKERLMVWTDAEA